MIVDEYKYGSIKIKHFINLEVYRSGLVGAEALEKSLQTKVITDNDIIYIDGLVDIDEIDFKNI